MKNNQNVETCRKYEKMVLPYLNRELNDDGVLDFYRHIINCPACKEELTIQYFVKVGIDEEEGPEDLDLLSGLDNRLNADFLKIVNKRSRRFGFTIFGLGFLIFVILFILF